MNILFATPPLSSEERYGRLAGAGSAAPSLGLLLLAAVARRAGHTVAVLDAAALDLSWEAFFARFQAAPPEVLALSATTLAIGPAARCAARARELRPGLTVLVGGPHVSAVPTETLERFPAFDLAVLGEGETVLLELLAALGAGSPSSAVPGVAWRDAAGNVHCNLRPALLQDLDSLPHPAWDLLEGFPARYAPAAFKTRRLPAASLVTSRGCPNHCIFCDRSVFGASCHAHSAEYVVGLMRELRERYGVREIAFEDDTFVTFRRRLEEICRQLIAERLDLSWTCLGRVNHVDAERLALMKRAGCWQISFGIESGSQAILDRLRKQVTLEQIRRALELCRAAGIRSKGFFIVGHPGETAETLAATRDFALQLPLDDLSVTMLTPFPGSEIYARAAEFGSFDPDWSKMNLLTPVFVPHGLIVDDLERAQRELLRRFYLRPRIVADYLARLAANPALAGALWRGFRSFLRGVR